jgi:copper oxidase (laccase) domain-containing protein
VPGKWRFDLWGANAHLLRHGGVPADQIAIARVPTGPGGEFFSHRAEQPCGRFALLATIAA